MIFFMSVYFTEQSLIAEISTISLIKVVVFESLSLIKF